MQRETWMIAAALIAAGCVVIEKGPGAEGGESEASVSAAPGTDSAGSTSAASEGGTGGATAAPTSGAPTLPPGHEEECLEDTAAGYDFAEWEDLPAFDPAGLAAIACPGHQPSLECSATPIAGLQSALIVRNDKLPAPKPYLPPMYRWIVVSNAPLGCDDPLGAPLCEGQWRIAWPMNPDDYCFAVLAGEWGSGFLYGHGSPVLLDRGDADCQTHAGTIAAGDDMLAQLYFPKSPEGLPVVAQQCLRCELPGVPPAQLAGQFTPQICP